MGYQPAERGRRAWVPEKEDFEIIARASSKGLKLRHIAGLLGIGYSTLKEKMQEYPDLAALIKKSKCISIENVQNTLYEKAVAGESWATMFFLERIGGLRKEINAHLVDKTPKSVVAEEAESIFKTNAMKSEY